MLSAEALAQEHWKNDAAKPVALAEGAGEGATTGCWGDKVCCKDVFGVRCKSRDKETGSCPAVKCYGPNKEHCYPMAEVADAPECRKSESVKTRVKNAGNKLVEGFVASTGG